MIHSKFLFLLSLCVASCCYGIVSARCEIFPYTVFRDATIAGQAYLQVYWGESKCIDPVLTAPSVRRPTATDDQQLFLLSGGPNFHAEKSSTGHVLAWIMDRSGRLRHVWEYDPAIWNDLQQVVQVPGRTQAYPVDVHVDAKGDLLVTFQGTNCWPYGIGIAKFNRDGKLLWKRETLSHHWFSVGDNGNIYTCAMRVVDSPLPIGNSAIKIESADGKIMEDLVLILDPEGNVLQEISMMDALVASGWIGLFHGASDDSINGITGDPTHLNDAQVITDQMAAENPSLKAGDLLVSFRSLNAIGILDVNSRRFRWICSGLFVRQHSPRIVGNHVLVFDNLGGDIQSGGSRLVSIDLSTGLPTTVFPRDQHPLEYPFRTTAAGHLDVLSPERVLVTLTNRSEVWEVDLRDGQVLWEYVYVDREDRERQKLYTAKYVRNLQFEFNQDKASAP